VKASLPKGYHLEQTESGYLLTSTREVVRHEPRKDPLHMGYRRVVRVSGTPSMSLLKAIAELDSQDSHVELSQLIGGVIRWGDIQTEGPPKPSGRNHDAVALPKLKELRVEQGLSSQRLHELSGVSWSHLKRMEAGVAKGGSDVLDAISDALGCERDELTA